MPADRLHALLPQRSIRENIAAPLFNRVARWGPINGREERRRVDDAVERLSIDTRAASQVRRLSGGNQQKVTIARWLAPGLRVMLLFDPTRGIDVGTKHQVYDLVRALADEGAAIVMFTSELREIGLVCDRSAVLHNGRIVAELPADAGESTLLSAAHGLEVGVTTRLGRTAPVAARRRSTEARTTLPEPPTSRLSPLARRQGWTAGVAVLLVVLLLWRVSQLPEFGDFEIRTITAGTMPLAFLAMAQARHRDLRRHRPVGRRR